MLTPVNAGLRVLECTEPSDSSSGTGNLLGTSLRSADPSDASKQETPCAPLSPPWTSVPPMDPVHPHDPHTHPEPLTPLKGSNTTCPREHGQQRHQKLDCPVWPLGSCSCPMTPHQGPHIPSMTPTENPVPTLWGPVCTPPPPHGDHAFLPLGSAAGAPISEGNLCRHPLPVKPVRLGPQWPKPGAVWRLFLLCDVSSSDFPNRPIVCRAIPSVSLRIR